MPMYTAVCIFFTIPIWSSFMAYAILKEPISIYDIFALISTFGGVLFDSDFENVGGDESRKMFLRVFSCRFLVSSSLFVIKFAVFFLLKK